MAAGGVYYDPETIELLRTVLEKAWSELSPQRQQRIQKTELAERILAAAAAGEREPERLRLRALMRPMVSPASQENQATAILCNRLARPG